MGVVSHPRKGTRSTQAVILGQTSVLRGGTLQRPAESLYQDERQSYANGQRSKWESIDPKFIFPLHFSISQSRNRLTSKAITLELPVYCSNPALVRVNGSNNFAKSKLCADNVFVSPKASTCSTRISTASSAQIYLRVASKTRLQVHRKFD